jgi:hypothetical protein
LRCQSIEHIVEDLLNREKLSYKKSAGAEDIWFESIQLAEDCAIQIKSSGLLITIKAILPAEIKEIDNILATFSDNHQNTTYINTKVNDNTIFKIAVSPFNKIAFENLFKKFCASFQREISPFLFGIIKDSPENFFITQYKNWKSLPMEEQVNVVENILQMKENFFKGIKSPRGIVNKLNKIKKDLASKERGEHSSRQSRIDNFEQFLYIDFAALFRAIELGLIHLTLENFFEGFSIRSK